jgi:hypothetical protein
LRTTSKMILRRLCEAVISRKVNSSHHPSVLHIKAGNNAFGQHDRSVWRSAASVKSTHSLRGLCGRSIVVCL